MSKFQKATKYGAKLRLAMIGPAGSGKTFSALSIAASLAPGGGRVAVIDTERGSASKYADQFDFDVMTLERHSPTDYVQAIKEADAAGFGVLVIDSLSHAWSGRGGALEMVDQIAKRARTPNSFGAWRDVTPLHNEMVDAILNSTCHVIVTMRAKTEWVQEKDERGKTVIRKVGLAPVQRDGLEYEFDVVGDLDQEHQLAITKSRCPALSGALVNLPGKQIAEVLTAWLAGAPAPVPAPKPQHAGAPLRGEESKTGPKIEDVLKLMQEATTEQQLVEVGPIAAALPDKLAAVARKAYAARLGAIRADAHRRQLVLSALASERGQALREFLGSEGIVLDSATDVSSLSSEQLENIETWLHESAPQDPA